MGTLRVTPLRKTGEKKGLKIIDEQPRGSRKSGTKASNWQENPLSRDTEGERTSDKLSSMIVFMNRQYNSNESRANENSKRKMPLASPLVLNKEQKQKLSKLLERANSPPKNSKNEYEYLLRAKLNELKSSKSKGQQKQKVFYCDTQNTKQGALIIRAALGMPSSKNFYSLKQGGKSSQDLSKQVPGPAKKLLGNQKNQSKSQTQFFIGAKVEPKKAKKKMLSDGKATVKMRDSTPTMSKESRFHSGPEQLAVKSGKNLKGLDKDSCSNTKTRSKVPTLAPEGCSFRQSEELRDHVLHDYPTASSRDNHANKVQFSIIKKIQLRKDQEQNQAAISIQRHVRGWLGRKLALQTKVLKSPYRNQKPAQKNGDLEVDLMKIFDKNSSADLIKRPLDQMRSARTNLKQPSSNKESIGPTVGTPTKVLAKVKLSKSWVDPADSNKEQKESAQKQMFEAMSGEEFCGKTISSQNFSKNTSFKGETLVNNEQQEQFYLKENFDKIDNKNVSQEKTNVPDPSQWPHFAKEQYTKWKKVTNILHNLEKQLGTTADMAIQSMLKELEVCAESSKKNFKEVFLINDSFASNGVSDVRSSKLDPQMKGNPCFERKMAIKGPKFINFIEKNSSEVSQNEELKRGDTPDLMNDSPSLSKKAFSSRWNSKEIMEKWVEPSDNKSVSSALGGIHLNKSNIILISQLQYETSPSKDALRQSPTSAASSARPHLLANVFSSDKPKPLHHSEINIIDNLKQADLLLEHESLVLRPPDHSLSAQGMRDKKISMVESREENSLQEETTSKDSFGDLQYVVNRDSLHKSLRESLSKSKEGLDLADAESNSNLEWSPKTDQTANKDNNLLADHISSVLLELLIEEAVVEANDIILDRMFPPETSGQGGTNPSLGVVSLGAQQEEYQIYTLPGINEYLVKLIRLVQDNYGPTLIARFNQTIQLDRQTVIRLLRELELELFSGGCQDGSEPFDSILRSYQGNFLDEEIFVRMQDQLPNPTTPMSADFHDSLASAQDRRGVEGFRRLLFDSMNEVLTSQWLRLDSLDLVRLISLGKQPASKPAIDASDLERLMLYAKDTVLDSSLFSCGMLSEKLEIATDYGRAVDPVLLRQVREERLVKMLAQEVRLAHLDLREREEVGIILS